MWVYERTLLNLHVHSFLIKNKLQMETQNDIFRSECYKNENMIKKKIAFASNSYLRSRSFIFSLTFFEIFAHAFSLFPFFLT